VSIDIVDTLVNYEEYNIISVKNFIILAKL